MLSFEDPSIVYQVKKGMILEASAGSGKTTILTERWLSSFLYLLVWERYTVSEALHSIVALTFTKKAATEMKQRIRSRIDELWSQDLEEFLSELKKYNGDFPEPLEKIIAHLNSQKIYIDDLLSSAKIMTINAFVFYLLRAYPLELSKDVELTPTESDATEKEAQIFILRRLILQDFPECQKYFKLGVHLIGLNKWISFFEQIRGLVSSFGEDAIFLGLRESNYFIYQDKIEEAVNSEAPLGEIFQLIKPSIDEVIKALETEHSYEKLTKDGVALYQTLSSCTVDSALTLFTLSFAKPKPLKKDLELYDLRMSVYTAYQNLIEKLYAIAIPLIMPISDLCGQELKNRQSENGEISFGDSEIVLLDFLKKSNLLPKIQSNMRFFFADEYQDTSDIQKEIFDCLIDNDNVVPFFVGDPKQSIYSFRKANVYVFSQTVQEFLARHYQRKHLNTNYRSVKDHVDLVNNLFGDIFSNSHIQYQNQLSTNELKGEFAYTLALESDKDTKYLVGQRLQQSLQDALLSIQQILSTGVSPGEIMVLFRNRASILDFYHLVKENAPLLPLSSSVKNILWDSSYIKPLVSFLKVLHRPHHDLTLIEFLKTPIFQKSDVEINQLLIQAKKQNTSLLNALPKDDKTSIQEILILKDRIPLEELISILVKETHYEEYLELLSETGDARATLSLFIEEAQLLQQKREMTLSEFVNTISQKNIKTEEAEFSGEEGETLRLMTIHSSKGLESPYVIYVHRPSTTEKTVTFPIYQKNKIAFNIFGKGHIADELSEVFLQEYVEEEKRLAYVACTRAEKQFMICGLSSLNKNNSENSEMKTQWEAFLNKELVQKYYAKNELNLPLFASQKIHSPNTIKEDLSAYHDRAEWLSQKKPTLQEFPQFLSVSLLLDVEFNPDRFYDKYIRRSFDLVDSLRELAEEEDFSLKTTTQSEIGTLVHRVLQEFDCPDRAKVIGFLQTQFPDKEQAFDLVLSYAYGYWESDFYKELIKNSDYMDKERQVLYLLPNDIMIRAIADLYTSTSANKHTIVDYKLSVGKNLERYHRQLSYYALLSDNQQIDEIVLFSLKEAKAYPLKWDKQKTQKQFDIAVQQAMQLLTSQNIPNPQKEFKDTLF